MHLSEEQLQRMTDPLLYTLASPVIIPIQMAFLALIMDFFLTIFQANRKGYKATFRSIAYAQSAYFLALIPLAGLIISPIWMVVLIIIGFKETHQIPLHKAITAFLTPFLLCILIFMTIGLFSILNILLRTL